MLGLLLLLLQGKGKDDGGGRAGRGTAALHALLELKRNLLLLLLMQGLFQLLA